jgi:hypothetical protein
MVSRFVHDETIFSALVNRHNVLAPSAQLTWTENPSAQLNGANAFKHGVVNWDMDRYP